MLGRTSNFENKPLLEYTKEEIYWRDKDGSKFILVDNNINKEFIDYLKEINANYTLYTNKNESDLAIYNEVYDKYDKLISPLLEQNEVKQQLKNEIIPADTGILQFTRKPSNSELRSVFIGEQLSDYLSKESDTSSDSLYYRISGRNFNEIWSSDEFTNNEKRRLLLYTIQEKLSDTNSFNGKLFRKIDKQFGNMGVQLVDSSFIIFAQNGKINLDINRFFDYLQRENIEDLDKYLEIGLSEELIHIVTSYIADANDMKNVLMEQIKNDNNFVNMLNQKYRGQDLTKNPFLVYNEYIRMLVQQEFLGITTEQVKYTRSGIIDRIIAKVWEFLKSVSSLPKTKEVIQKHIDFIKNDIEFEKQDSNIITPLDTSPSNQEGVNFVFEQNPELANIGTKEQYAEYIKTIFPESKVQDILHHGVTRFDVIDFNKFSEDKQSTGTWGKGFYFAPVYNKFFEEAPIEKYVKINSKKIITNKEHLELYEKYKKIGFQGTIGLADTSKMFEEVRVKFDTIDSRDREIIVFNPSQIHILGNKQDQEMFSNFVNNISKTDQKERLPVDSSNYNFNLPCITDKK
jgi:hypothetical protein